MYVILGASGNTGHIVAQNLLARQQKVRVVGRNAAHLQPHAAKGAEIFIGDVTDASALTKAFQQADSAYVMIPPNPVSTDPLGYQERVSDAIAAAVKNTGIKNVVALSSIGADKNKGTGPVVGLHNLEQKLNQIDSANVLHLRAGGFMENTLPQVGAIRMAGAVIGPESPRPEISHDRNSRHRSGRRRCPLKPGLPRQTDPRTAGRARSRLYRSCQHHWQGHRQTRSQICQCHPTSRCAPSWFKWECPSSSSDYSSK